MTVSLAAQAMVMISTAAVLLHAEACPMIKGIAQALITAVAHDHLPLSFTTLMGNRGGATVGPQGVIISLRQRLRSLGEHRGGNDASYSRDGEDQLHVTMLRWFLVSTKSGELFFDPP